MFSCIIIFKPLKKIREEKMERVKADIEFSDQQNSYKVGKQVAAEALKKICIQKIHIDIRLVHFSVEYFLHPCS